MIYLKFFLVVLVFLFVFLVFKIFTKNHHKIITLQVPKMTLVMRGIATGYDRITYQHFGLEDFIHKEINAYLSIHYSTKVNYEITRVDITEIEDGCLGSVFISFRVIDL